LSRKSIDIGVFCCPPDTTDRFPDLKFHTLGISAIAFFVHPDNAVDNITVKQARDIFQGKTYRWADVMSEGKGRKTSLLIQPVGRLHCKLRPGHWRLLLDNEDLFSPGLLEIGAIPDMISMVAINKRAIGYEIPWMTKYYNNTGRVKILRINGYSPNEPADVLSTDYPFYRVYSFTTWEADNVKNPHAQKLVDHLMEQSEHLDSKYSFIPASRLRLAGWKFRNNELVGEPD
jgi:ABC-type phosphate transport system substrate-binding protein